MAHGRAESDNPQHRDYAGAFLLLGGFILAICARFFGCAI